MPLPIQYYLEMPHFVQALFQADFLPHGWCYRWDPAVVWLHVVSDLLIALSYYLIPFALVYILKRRKDLVYPWMFWLFGAFILACGTTHLMSVYVVWYPWYRLDGIVKLITALVSVPTAMLMFRVAPAVVAIPGPEELRRVNRRLEQEISERMAAEREVRSLNEDLERRVQERTRELEVANHQLRQSEKRQREILDSSPTLIFLKDLEGRFQFVNRSFEANIGLTREEVFGRTDSDVFPAELSEAYLATDREVRQTGQPIQSEAVVMVDGEPRTFMSTKFPLTDDNGKIYALCGISADITDRKKSEQNLRRYNEELEQFAHVVSHDLQEPLRTVKSYAQLLTRRYRGRFDSDADEFIDFIVGGVNRMHALITGLQAYTELNRSPIAPLRSECDASAVLDETLRAMETSIREAGAEVQCHPLPHVRVTSTHLGQLFQNLISNGIKYRRPDEPPRLEVSARSQGKAWEFIVADNGVGVEMEYAEQIFGVFRRLAGREVPGTGIGLAICKKVVESYGGRIWVTTAESGGAEFHFTLPGL